MSEELTHATGALWFHLPTQLRYHVIKTFLNYDDATALALTCRQAIRDMDVYFRQMMSTDEIIRFHPKALTNIDQLLAAFPAHWEVTCLSSVRKDRHTQLAVSLLQRGPIRWLALYLDQVKHAWTPWDWICLAATLGRVDHLQYMLYRWQIYSLDHGHYQFTLLPSHYGRTIDSLNEVLIRQLEHTATPLQLGTFQEHSDIVELVSRYGHPSFHLRDKDNTETALMIAVELGMTPLVEALVKAGANPNRLNTHQSQTAYHLSVSKERVEIVRYFKKLSSHCVWSETRYRETAHDLLRHVTEAEVIRLVDPPIPNYKRISYGLISALIGSLLSPFIALAQTLHAIWYVMSHEIPSQMKDDIVFGLQSFSVALIGLPIIIVINLITIPIVGIVTGFKMGWRYQQQTVFNIACYAQKTASMLSYIIESAPYITRYYGYDLYVTNTPEYYYLSFGAILTGTFTLLAALNVFSPLTLIFPVLNTWPAWQIIGLTAVAAIVLATSLCQLVDAIRYEQDNARLLKKAADKQKPDTLLDEKTLYERLHPTQEQREDHRTCHRSVSVFDQAPVLKQAADGQLVQLGQLTI